VLDRCTASRVLSVAYATEKSREKTGCAVQEILRAGAILPIGPQRPFLRWTFWVAIGPVSPDIAAQANVGAQGACLK